MVTYAKHGVIVAAFICGCLWYGGIVPHRTVFIWKSVLPIEDAVQVTGTIRGNPLRAADGSSYMVRLRLQTAAGILWGRQEIQAQAQGCIRVQLPADVVESLYPGRLYSAPKSHGILVESGEYLECAGYWDAQRQLFRSDKAWQQSRPSTLTGRILHFRSRCRLLLKQLLYSWGSAGGLVLALLSGSREYLDEGVGVAFRNAGLSHIMALSGMHLAFFATLAENAGTLCFGKRHAIAARLAGICLFTWFAGFSPSLCRAFLYATLLLLADAVHYRNTDMLVLLAAVFLVHGVFFPDDIHTLSFMLSYAALAGILLFSPCVQRIAVRYLPPSTAKLCAASICAHVGTMPLCALYFGAIMPLGPLASIIVSPLVGIFFTGAVITLCASLVFSPCVSLCAVCMNGIYDVIIGIVAAFAHISPLYVKII